MKIQFKHIIYLIVIILLLGVGFYVGKKIEEKNTDKAILELKKERIQNDSLTKVKDGLYTKLAADTLTIKELKEVNDSLGLELQKPKEIVYIKTTPKDSENKEIEIVTVKDTTITTEDYYPQKENYFVRYSSEVNTKTGQGVADWNFNGIDISIGLEEQEDGTWKSNIKAPDYLNVNKVDILSEPREEQETLRKHIQFIAGGGYSTNFSTEQESLRANIGLRLGNIILMVGGTTNNQVDATLNYQF